MVMSDDSIYAKQKEFQKPCHEVCSAKSTVQCKCTYTRLQSVNAEQEQDLQHIYILSFEMYSAVWQCANKVFSTQRIF